MANEDKQLTPILSQIELFKTTKKLNLSQVYEAIPKEVYKTDPCINWVNERLADPVKKPFSLDGQSFVSEIAPASIEDKKTGQYKSKFPELREARIEYAIISIVSKQQVKVEGDNQHNRIFKLYTTYYQIQKEIVEAINKVSNKDLKPNNCPYNTTEIKEALEILKKTNITVKNEAGEGVYIFTRIKDIYMDNKNVVIELGTMITNYIESGDWISTDKNRILASRGKYELRLRVLINLKFRYASRGTCYSPSLSFLVQQIDFKESKDKRTTLQRMLKELNKLEEIQPIQAVEVEKIFDGKRLVDAKFHIYATDDFISETIENNALSKRVKTDLIDKDGSPLIEPMPRDYATKAEYQKALREYEIERGKAVFAGKWSYFDKLH